MLRISELNVSIETVTLRLEGQLTDQWIEVTREACEQVLCQSEQLILDVAGISFANRTGITLLHELQQRQVRLINCSPFLQEQLKSICAIKID